MIFPFRCVNIVLPPSSSCAARQVFLSLTLHERNLLSLDFLKYISKAAAALFLEQQMAKHYPQAAHDTHGKVGHGEIESAPSRAAPPVTPAYHCAVRWVTRNG